jgi:hypothetical protein
MKVPQLPASPVWYPSSNRHGVILLMRGGVEMLYQAVG